MKLFLLLGNYQQIQFALKLISNYFFYKLIKLYHKFIENIKIQQIAKIKILQIITKSSRTSTNMILKSCKKFFEHKIKYGEQCLFLPFLQILSFSWGYPFKIQFLSYYEVSRNGKFLFLSVLMFFYDIDKTRYFARVFLHRLESV